MFNLKDILLATNGKVLNKINKDIKIKGITTDSRDNCKEKLFIPLKGTNFNGHNFIKDAVEKGAVAFLTEIKVEDYNVPAIKVSDTLKAYGDIAKAWINKNNTTIIGITGTCGKTTIKELLKHITMFKGTEKNFNNLIGVPKTILSFKEKNLILELGSNLKGEIKKLTDITTPEFAVITSIGYGHIEGFSSIENIYKEKLEIINNNSDLIKGIVPDYVFNSGYLKRDSKFLKSFGLTEKADAMLLESKSDIEKGNKIKFLFKNREIKVKSKLLGKFNALNILAAFLVSVELGFNEDYILKRIESFEPVAMRNEIIKSNKGYYIFNDCYNANYDSFKSAISLFNEISVNGIKYLVIGDMFELGELSRDLHIKLGEIILSSKINNILAYGKEIQNTVERVKGKKSIVKLFSDKKEIIDFLKKTLSNEDAVLVKASRGMNFEQIIEGII